MDTDNIKSLLTPPQDWQWSELRNSNEQKIRYGWSRPKNPKALVVLAEGRTECIEEYFELINDLNIKGYACAIMDWQGQGKSYRYFDDNKRHHSEGFEHDVSDFITFIKTIETITELQKLPKLLLAHSMGANITLRYLENNPNIFECAYLVAPMLGIQPKRTIKYLAPTILKMASSIGKLHKHALGQTAWNEVFANIAKHKVSSDPVRRERQPYLFKHYPQLRCGGVTFGWLKHALASIEHLQKKSTCSAIQTPIFIAMAGKDIVVDNQKTHNMANLLPNCDTQIFDQAEHQIHCERDDIRHPLLDTIEIFFKKHL